MTDPNTLYSNTRSRRLTEDGQEILDPTPVAPPVGFVRQPSLAEQIRQMVRSEKLALEAEAAGFETFEEADDFNVGDDYDPRSPFEEHFEPTPIEELKRRKMEAEKVIESPPPSPPAPPQEPKVIKSDPD